MRITAIEFAGTPKTVTRDGEGLARAFARVERRSDGVLEITVMTPSGTHARTVRPDCDDNFLFYRAQELQETLDGHVGTNSDVHDYYRELERLLGR